MAGTNYWSPKSGNIRCHMKILELMKVHTIVSSPEATIAEVVDLFDLYQLSVLYVVDSRGVPIGSISEKSISELVCDNLLGQNRVITAGEIMRWPNNVVDEHSEVEEALRLFRDDEVENIGVTSVGRLIGTVRRIDICQAILAGDLVLQSQ